MQTFALLFYARPFRDDTARSIETVSSDLGDKAVRHLVFKSRTRCICSAVDDRTVPCRAVMTYSYVMSLFLQYLLQYSHPR